MTLSFAFWQVEHPPDYIRGSCSPRLHQPGSKTGLEGRGDTGVTPDSPLIEDSDRISATNSEVESAMNHRRRRATLHDPNFSEEAFNAFNSGEAYIRAAQDGLARATDQYVKDIRVRKFDKYVYQ